MGEITFKELVIKVLEESNIPMTPEEIWNYCIGHMYSNLVDSQGKTPWRTLGAQLYVDIKEKGNESKFIKVGRRPTKFFLNGRKISDAKSYELKTNLVQKNAGNFDERDLHKLLTYYVYNHFRVYTKTIRHEKSNKKEKGANEWLHPDIVGFYTPINEWDKSVLDLNKVTGNSAIKLFSFELKKELNFGNLRQHFFQAVSNSSWANEGYLVAANIDNGEEFFEELKRLSTSFGIGIIKLNVKEPEESGIVLPAKFKTELDWDTINKLCEENSDYKEFLSDAYVSLTSKLYKTAFDKVYNLEELRSEFNK